MSITRLAVLGGDREFHETLPVGQLYFPSWDRYVDSFRGVFKRQYYTNQGPLTLELEEKIASHLGIRHAICVTNMTIGLMILAEAMQLTGKVILPAFTFAASAQSLIWNNLEVLFCDVDPMTHHLDTDHVESLIDNDVSAIMGINLWGDACDIEELESIVRNNGLKLYFDSAHAFGSKVDRKFIGGFGDAEVFSFHATKMLSASEGGCICTNDDELAFRLENIRSSYGVKKFISVPRTANGRMSEAQAAIALLNFEDLESNIAHNRELFECYREHLSSIPGVYLREPTNGTGSNHQYLVCELDESEFGISRDKLLKVLVEENVYARRYFYPGLHKVIPFSAREAELPGTDLVCSRVFQLPNGAMVDCSDIERICSLIAVAQRESGNLSQMEF